jgi:group I intron endonuclease
MIYGGSKMYLYQITNLINGKIYIGKTNNITKRWSNHRCGNSPNMVIAKAIQKYGKENFKFEILYRNISIDEIDELEIQTIKDKNCRVPNGYNVAKGGQGGTGVSKHGADNANAHLTEQEAQYILDHRNIPMYVLYDEVSDKLTYEQFKRLYHHQTYTNLHTDTPEYPYNNEFSNQFTSGGKLEYDDVVQLRKRYAAGEYWKDVYKDYTWAYTDEMTFWNVYYGNRYKLVMPEVFTKENRHYHSSLGKQGGLNGRAKLTEDDVRKIRKLWKEGATRQELYEMYPQVTPTSIRGVINNKTWKNLL